MRNLLIVPVLIILATLIACATPSPEATAPGEVATLGVPTDEPTSGSTDRPIMAPTVAVEPAATETTVQSEPTWRGIAVATEHRCSPYDSDDYPYPASVEPKIVDSQGGIYGPYTGTWFDSIKDTDIEHIVARSEAHDSGLCSASPATKARFASDLLNLTLASPSVNRHQKVANDAAQWLPDLNECWYVAAHHSGPAGIRPDYRPSRGRRDRQSAGQMRIDGDDHIGSWAAHRAARTDHSGPRRWRTGPI